MAEDDRVNERLHRKFEEAFGEPEATLVMNRLASTEDFRLVKDEIVLLKHEMELFEQRVIGDLKGFRGELGAMEERLRAEIQSGLRKQMATMLTVMGIFNAVVFAALRFG